MSDAEEKNTSQPRLRAGVLTSSLTIELHTHYAIRLWAGRRREEISSTHKVTEILGMPQLIRRAGKSKSLMIWLLIDVLTGCFKNHPVF